MAVCAKRKKPWRRADQRVPRPRLNLMRFHGVFAPNFKHRARIVPRRAQGRVEADTPLAPMSWAQRLKRVLQIDIETCPERRLNTGGGLRAAQEAPGVCRSARAAENCGSLPASKTRR
jgi:hypothetical protein